MASDFSLVAGVVVYVTPSNTNTGNPTLNVNSTGAKNIVTRSNVALSPNEIVATKTFGVMYGGTSWRVITYLCRVYGVANPVNPTIECAGYDEVSAFLSFSSVTGAGITFAHLRPGISIHIDISNGTASTMAYWIAGNDPTGTAIPYSYWIPTATTSGGGATRIDPGGSIPNLSSGLDFFAHGTYIRTGGALIFK